MSHFLSALGERLDALSYPVNDGRDLRFDFLRGLAVLAMVVDHLGGPSALYLLTGGNRFFTSAAEAFVLLSGVMAGLVYGRLAQHQSLGVALRRLLGRAWLLYMLAVSLTLVMLPLSAFLGLTGGESLEALAARDRLQLLWRIFTLHQTAYLVDIPLLYALLLVTAPVALLLMHERKTWIVLTVSWVLWGGYQLFPEQTDIPWQVTGNNLFNFPAWQVLFFNGMALGYHRERLRAAIPRARQWLLLLAAAIGFGGLLVLFAVIQSALAEASQPAGMLAVALEERLFSKTDVQIGRLVASLFVFGFVFLGSTRFWVPLRWGLGWLLLPLGQHALYAYTAHVLLALLIALACSQAHFSFAAAPGVSGGVQLAGLALVWLGIRWRVLFPTRTTRRVWMLSPAPLSMGLLMFLSLAPVGMASPGSVALPQAAPGPPTSESDATRIARVYGTPVPRLPDLAIARPPTPPLPEQAPVSVPTVGANEHDNPYAAAIQAGIKGTLREVFFYSAALDREMSYYVYLPPSYGRGERRYPVLYMLHGGGGSKDEWPAYGLIFTADRLMATGDVGEMIIVVPQGDKGYWVNNAYGGPRWGDHVVHDVVPNVDMTLRTLSDPDHRAVGGLSMGGAGALQLAFNNPDVFHVAGAHSPALHIDDGSIAILGTGKDFDQREPLKLAASAPGIEMLTIWLDAGQDDPWLDRDELLHQVLVARGVIHEWSILPGGHEGAYWNRNLESYLRFYTSTVSAPAEGA